MIISNKLVLARPSQLLGKTLISYILLTLVGRNRKTSYRTVAFVKVVLRNPRRSNNEWLGKALERR